MAATTTSSSIDGELAEAAGRFLKNYCHEDIAMLAQSDEKSLTIEYADLYRFDHGFAEDYLTDPKRLNKAFRTALREYDLPVDADFSQTPVRITDTEEMIERRAVADLEAEDLGTFVAVEGQLSKVTELSFRFKSAVFQCLRCPTKTSVPQSRYTFQEPNECQGCERDGPYQVSLNDSVLYDQRKLKLETPPEGRVQGEGESVTVYAERDLCHIGGDNGLPDRAGERVVILGRFNGETAHLTKSKRPEMDGHLVAESIVFVEKKLDDITVDETRERFEALARGEEGHPVELLKDSLVPRIERTKQVDRILEAAVAWLFNGYRIDRAGGNQIRGDLHMALIGDPSTAKSTIMADLARIAPKSVFRSGGSISKVGLCVAGDTWVQTADGVRRIEELAEPYHPEPVVVETAADAEIRLPTYDDGGFERTTTSHVWRMPEKPCHRIETRRGKSLTASDSTPVLVCNGSGVEWRPVKSVTPGEYVATPRRLPPMDAAPAPIKFFELADAVVDLAGHSRQLVKERLGEEFETYRQAALAMDVSEHWVYWCLIHQPVEANLLERALDAVGLDWTDLDVERIELAQGHGVAVPDQFSEDLMWLLGFILGDGSVKINARGKGRGVVRIANRNNELLDEACRIIRSEFGKQARIESGNNDRPPEVRIHSATIARFCKNLGLPVAGEKSSAALHHALTSARTFPSFLSGLYDADGWVSTGSPETVGLSTTSEELAEQVMLTLQRVGIDASIRERPRAGTVAEANGRTVVSRHDQYTIELRGDDADLFANVIAFRSDKKAGSLEQITGSRRKTDTIPVGPMLAASPAPTGEFKHYFERGTNPGREKAAEIAETVTFDGAGVVKELAAADLRWEEVTAVEDAGTMEVYDLTVPETHNFVASGIVTHNTAAAQQEEFAGKTEWTLEPGVLPRANGGHCLIDEVDEVLDERSKAIHDALEGEQMVKVDKAGISADLPTRTAVCVSGNPKDGRFDPYAAIDEQLDMDPALISRMDVLLPVTDELDPEIDSRIADHVLESYDELSRAEVAEREGRIPPDPETTKRTVPVDVFRDWVHYARQECFPTLSPEARDLLRQTYLDIRNLNGGYDGSSDSPIPATSRVLESAIRLSTGYARVELADEVDTSHAERARNILKTSIGLNFDAETGQFDADLTEAALPKNQRDQMKTLRGVIEELTPEYDGGPPKDDIIEAATDVGFDADKAEHTLEKMQRRGEVYEPPQGGFLLT